MDDVKRGDIYWIFKNPYISPTIGNCQDNESRPAVIVSNEANNKFSPTVEVVYLTTSSKKDLPTHCTIRSSEKVSTALCEQISTISKDQLGSRMGSVTDEELSAIETCMLISLGIDIDMPEPTAIPEPDKKAEEMSQREKDIADIALEATIEADTYKKLYNELLERLLNRTA